MFFASEDQNSRSAILDIIELKRICYFQIVESVMISFPKIKVY